ncbi:hypothetical protein [Nocardia arthritidis]|uniref:Uncharacterized protein n=1 Tax=Nocardia arthritidis TaxID=228602 RepID=A0A6G9YMY9_9NOCA|nr:hypothetical protein [Nocardia arthritidis]QIS14568.1 hypothetical protein F5544_33660 [Nocardia arthritidis]
MNRTYLSLGLLVSMMVGALFATTGSAVAAPRDDDAVTIGAGSVAVLDPVAADRSKARTLEAVLGGCTGSAGGLPLLAWLVRLTPLPVRPR